MFRKYPQYFACYFILATLMIVSNQVLARGCASSANVGCSIAECLALQANKDTACSGKKSCERIATGCSDLRAMKSIWLSCYTARNIINNRCYAGGDWDHQWQAAEAIRHVGICNRMIALPEPIGCADPCP